MQRMACIAQAGGDLKRCPKTDEIFPVTGRRDCTGGVVRVDAGPDDRAVADAAGHLAGHPPGRGGGGEIAIAVTRDGAHGTMTALLVVILDEAATATFELVLQCPPALRRIKISVISKGDALLSAKGERPLADQQHMVGKLHHCARRQYRIARPEDSAPARRP